MDDTWHPTDTSKGSVRRALSHRPWLWVAIVFVIAALPVGVAMAEPGPRPTVLVIGDSLTYESAAAISQDLTAEGYQPDVHAVPGSGILDTQINWLQRAQQYVQADKPAIVVVEFIGDYGLFGELPGIADRTPAFDADWAARAQSLEDALASSGARVYWVVGPPLQNPVDEQTLLQLDSSYSHLHVPGVAANPPLIDITKTFGTATGGYTPNVPGPGGTPVVVRLTDGIHFTPAGVALYAQDIASGISR
jgi:hypothetical protein